MAFFSHYTFLELLFFQSKKFLINVCNLYCMSSVQFI